VSLQEIQKTQAPDGSAAGTSPAVAGAEATTTQSRANSESAPAVPGSRGGKRKSSVAAQQKSNKQGLVPTSAASVDYAKHTDEELHNATVAALAAYKQKRGEVDNCVDNVLIPALNQIIHRYKQQGRATPYRLNDCPTVEEYFEKIGLNYSTVRSWKYRAQQRLLQVATDAGTKPAPVPGPDPVPHFNKAARKALIEGNHKAVEIVAAVEAGRDAKNEIADFKAVMNAKRLDDILQAHEQEPDYKGILQAVLHLVKENETSLPADFIMAVKEVAGGSTGPSANDREWSCSICGDSIKSSAHPTDRRALPCSLQR
jgi:hypothetical protein